MRATVLGIDVEFSGNDPAVLAAAVDAFGAAITGPVAQCAAMVQVIVDDAAAPAHGGPIRHERNERGLIVTGSGCAGVVDVALRTAAAVVSTAVVRSRATFREDVLEALTLGMLTRLDRQPLHAAALALSGAVLLLHGPSGAGKSTLALAAAAAGIDAVADDIVFVQERPRTRVWTRASAFHVLPAAALRLGLDPSGASVRVRNGTAKVAWAAPTPGTRAYDRFGLCLVGPRSERPRMTRLTPDEAVRRIDVRADPGFDHFADSMPLLLPRLAQGGAWLLEPSADPCAAVPLLAAMLDDVAAGARAS
jgi:hypothetical protein